MDGKGGVLFATAGKEAGRDLEWARRHMVGRDYFETAGIPILAGRGFRKEDEANGAAAVVVSQELVHKFWKGAEPLGRQLDISNDEASGGFFALPGTIDNRASLLLNGRRVFEVVGVAKDVSEDLVASKKHPAIYFPLHPADYAQPSLRGVTLMVRAVPGADVISAVRREISAMASDLTPFNTRSMAEQIAQFMSALKAASWTYGLIGVFGLILASVGLAGVTAYSVAQRSHEIGIRMALGAQKRDVLSLVMRDGATLVTLGTVICPALACAGVR